MKLLRHILSHLILISILIGVVSVFYYRSFLLPNGVVGKIDGFVKDVYPPALNFVSKRDYFWSISGERIVSFDDLKFFEKNDNVTNKLKPDEVAMVESKAKPEVVDESVIENEVESVKTSSEKVSLGQTENENKVEHSVVKAKADEPPIVKEALDITEQAIEPVAINKNAEELPVIVKDSDTSSERELLVRARNAFNHGMMAKSEKFYIQLTELDHDNADIFGELGNVYYSQGKWNEAGLAYYEAATRLITDGNYNQVSYLQQVIKGLNTEHAEKLAQLMLRR